jgi:hypothetical protein
MGRVLLNGDETRVSLPRPERRNESVSSREELEKLVEDAIRTRKNEDKGEE